MAEVQQTAVEPAATHSAAAIERPHIFCLACGYDVTGINRHTCPECDRPFDPADPLSVGHPPKSHEPELERGLIIVGVLLLAVNVGLFFRPEVEPFMWMMWFWVALMVIFVLLLLTGVRMRQNVWIGITALYLFGVLANFVIGM